MEGLGSPIHNILKAVIGVGVGVCEVTVVWTDFDNSLSILQNDLEPVLWLPVAVAFDGNIDAFVSVCAARHHGLAAEPDMAPDVARGVDGNVLFV